MAMSVFNRLLYSSVFLTVVLSYQGRDLDPGPFCGKNYECCRDREDTCGHEISGTMCYCDEFCDREPADDCCPDYEPVCKGITPTTSAPEPIIQKSCYFENRVYPVGDTRMDNCNECTCRKLQGGSVMWMCNNDTCLMSEPLTQDVNRSPRGWTAHTYKEFWGRSLRDGIRLRLGTLPLRPETRHMGSIRYEAGALPERFDARTHWPRRYISPVRDQGWCGSDWAISTAAVLSDRFSIQTKGANGVSLSGQTLLSCNARGQQGCDGGHIDSAWQFSSKYGLVSEECLPYKARSDACPFPVSTKATSVPCPSGSRERLYRSWPPSKLSTEEDIMYDILNWGPVQAVMTVYQDFFHYRAGVYRHTSFGDTRVRGQHSVRVVGWGEERGDKYWIVANSWGEMWGESGYVRIAKDDAVTALTAIVVTVSADVSDLDYI